MVNIIKQELEIEETLRKKIEFICEFAKYYKVSIDYLCGKSKKSEI